METLATVYQKMIKDNNPLLILYYVYMSIISQRELGRIDWKRSNKKENQSTKKREDLSKANGKLPFHDTLQMFVFTLVVISLQLP